MPKDIDIGNLKNYKDVLKIKDIHDLESIDWNVVFKNCKNIEDFENQSRLISVIHRLSKNKDDTNAVSTTKQITNSLDMKFNYIPPGTFIMGSPESESGRYKDELQHQVTLTNGFYIQTTPVTQEQYDKITGYNPSVSIGLDNPVDSASWDDAKEFIKKLNELEAKQNSPYRYTLPTEAQWEYAARGGAIGKYYNGDTVQDLDKIAWCYENSRREVHPVAQKLPNFFGLYDMLGNVWEWCEDWYGGYPISSVTNPTGPSYGSYKALRGGSWYSESTNCRLASRNYDSDRGRNVTSGFRLVLLAGHQ